MMKKLFNVFSRRVTLSEILSPGDAVNPGNALCGCSQISKAGYSVIAKNYSAAGSVSDRIYAPYSIYKGKAALSLSPSLPTFKKLDSGSGLKVDRRGSMMLKFWPAVGERKYDWEKRQLFALSPTEMGAIISLGPKESCEFFHDPSMKSSNAGQVRKSLSIKPTQDGTGYFISLSVVNNILKSTDRFTVPVTTAEFAVMKTACSFALPQVMGWDRSSSSPQQQKMEQKPTSKVDPQLLDLEWDK